MAKLGRPRKNPLPEEGGESVQGVTLQDPPPEFTPGPPGPEDEAEAKHEPEPDLSGMNDKDGQVLRSERPEALAEADMARRRGVEAPPSEPEREAPRIITALRSCCICGTTLARLKGDKTWSCLRVLSGNDPRKSCQTGIPLDAVKHKG